MWPLFAYNLAEKISLLNISNTESKMTHTTKKVQTKYCIGTKEIWENNSTIRKAYWNKLYVKLTNLLYANKYQLRDTVTSCKLLKTNVLECEKFHVPSDCSSIDIQCSKWYSEWSVNITHELF